jgi:RNA polymerase sigma-70 factor (ECF subfamily)
VSTRDHQDPSDEALVEAARSGRVQAFETLLDRHQGRVLRILRFLGIPAQDREDVAQEIFVRVFKHLSGFRTGQEFGAWLYRVTVNAAHDHRGRAGRRARGEGDWETDTSTNWTDPRPDPEKAAFRPDPEKAAFQRELRDELDRALESLTERERTIFVLREIEGLESREVARALGITGITVRRHLSRARRRLRDILGEEAEKKAVSIERIAPGRGSPS